MSALENEVTGDSTTFDHFGRSWTVPTRRHLRHLRRLQAGMNSNLASYAGLVAEVFLSEEDYDALCVLDPTEDDLKEFSNKIADSLGIRTLGNS